MASQVDRGARGNGQQSHGGGYGDAARAARCATACRGLGDGELPASLAGVRPSEGGGAERGGVVGAGGGGEPDLATFSRALTEPQSSKPQCKNSCKRTSLIVNKSDTKAKAEADSEELMELEYA